MDDFSHVHNRKATYSLKWDELQTVFNTTDILPMWVADMDFQAPNVVNEAIKQRDDHCFYGYSSIYHAVQRDVSYLTILPLKLSTSNILLTCNTCFLA